MTFDPTKPVQTRDGRPARIICADREGRYPIIALIAVREGKELIRSYREDGGRDAGLANHDLVNIPEKRSIWVNFYKDGNCSYHDDRVGADERAKYRRFVHPIYGVRRACVHLTLTEGDGISDEEMQAGG